MIFVREDVPVKTLFFEDKSIEAFFFELNLHKNIWLECCSSNTKNKYIGVEESIYGISI